MYITKYETNGFVEKHKAHVMTKGSWEVKEIDYPKIFSLIGKMYSKWYVFSPLASQGW